MEQEAYDSVKMALAWYFLPLKQPFLPMYGMDLCYSRQLGTSAGNDNILPTITFHFPGADLDVTSRAFLVFPDYLCLAIVPHQFDFVTVIIGNLAQSNHRFLFNVLENTVTFAKEECKLGS
ncbi:hypothetical protein IFM89_034854 [Coptis chinensis]|uniref:Xylanase inhibitor C-terminal domain-containing protein n=1 Tax=Coptis chinensis TaxID=261450 RepID=A0A835I5J8_9MAGN|nr:hypothetical protein IFM89_034854 [Coptis chinensis]